MGSVGRKCVSNENQNIQLVLKTCSSFASGVPPDVPQHGTDLNGQPLFTIRAQKNNENVPGKFNPSSGKAWISQAGSEIQINPFEVLVAKNVKWIASADGAVAVAAVPGGKSNTGEVLYIGRVPYSGSITPGKIHPSHKGIYITFGGKEVFFSKGYEILVYL